MLTNPPAILTIFHAQSDPHNSTKSITNSPTGCSSPCAGPSAASIPGPISSGKTSEELIYFLSSLPTKVRAIAKHLRTHWTVENQ